MTKRNERLEQTFAAAVEGSESAQREFFEAFLEGPLFVPERYQRAPLSDAPQYPSDLVSMLGIQDHDRVVVPVFSTAPLIKEWCGTDLSFREHSGLSLCKVVPDGWWVCVNPGSELQKELSPWEIARLREGPESIDEIIAELQELPLAQLELTPIAVDEHRALCDALATTADTLPELDRIYLAQEALSEAPEETRLVVVAQLRPDVPPSEKVRTTLEAAAARAQIGDRPVRVWLATPNDALLLGPFQKIPPVFARRRSILSRLLGRSD